MAAPASDLPNLTRGKWEQKLHALKVYGLLMGSQRVDEHRASIRCNVERRLEFVEFRLFWEGRVNRSDLIEQFGISVPQASHDLKKYQELAPGNLHYDGRLKTYVGTNTFAPLFLTPSADRYLAQLRTVAAKILAVHDTWLGELPTHASVPLLRRPIAPELLRAVVQSIRSRMSIHIRYQSISHPVPQLRWIAPHAIGFDGFRWHARAWCFEHREFRDFVLARIFEVTEKRPAEIRCEDDQHWNQQVAFELVANPGLPENARRAVEQEYGMQNGVLRVLTSVALSYYFERQLNLDLPAGLLPPERQLLLLANRAEVESARLMLGGSGKDQPYVA